MPPEISWIPVGPGKVGLTALPVTETHRAAVRRFLAKEPAAFQFPVSPPAR